MLVDGARRNPIALGLIAAGAIWLVSDKDSKVPSLPKSDKSGTDDFGDLDVHHRDYVSHMSSIEQRADEDAIAYQRRRDTARSNFFMVERDYEEDDSSFRQRLDGMTEKFREKRRAWADSSDKAQVATKEQARSPSARRRTSTPAIRWSAGSLPQRLARRSVQRCRSRARSRTSLAAWARKRAT